MALHRTCRPHRTLHESEFDTVLGRFGFDEKGDAGLPSFILYIWRRGAYCPLWAEPPTPRGTFAAVLTRIRPRFRLSANGAAAAASPSEIRIV